ncbi:MAG: PSD1 and planctomycete cytochrome C domain-containing protein [Gemmataceae bacterium]|nr:PSD1 and planctomycete cytochrome C domain-containing protein [Gemmataceae bacterium]
MTRLIGSLSLVLAVGSPGRAAPPVDFGREVRPILAEHCTLCHGVDPKHRKGKLRLDTADGSAKGGSSGDPAVVPGDPDKSELYRRITSHDADVVMPPPDEKKPLTDAQKQVIRRWIAEGAKYEAHWAFVPPVKAPPPAGAEHPIDAFVRDRLRREKLTPAGPAPNSTLCRRLYLDLIGLPPSPDELAAYERDGFEKTVDRLLASGRFGEKWARHWLDLARYSDTNGYEKDLPREMWAWRDWVIAALNRDMPYDRFVIEQVAGDLIAGATQDQVIATGFLRNSMINEEGAIVPEQFRMVEQFDRLDCLGKAVLGLSAQCAQCHTHKFDPLTHREYFGLFAFLNNTYEAQSAVYTPEQLKQIESTRGRIRAVEDRARAARPGWEAELAACADALAAKQPAWTPIEATELGSVSGLNHPTQEADKSLLMKGHTSDEVFAIASPALDGVTGLRLEALPNRDLPHGGPGRSRLGTWAVKGIDVWVKPPGAKDWEKVKLAGATADFAGPDPKHSAANIVDGKDDTAWVADRGPGRRNQPSAAVVRFEKPLTHPAGTQLKVSLRMGDMLGCARLSLTTAADPAAPPVDHAAVLASLVPAKDRTPAQREALFAAWRRSVPELDALNREIDEQYKSLPTAGTTVLHLAERGTADPRQTHLLDRGEWDRPREEVPPGTPAALHPFPADQPRDRLGFARWLVDRRSPLAARVAVNQTWQAVFGVGLVETPEDFGTRAPVPEHRELLDWLAVDFMDHGWSRKHLIRTIVTSETYRQSSAATKELSDRDPRNRLLARGPRFRADAEVVRDIALAASGLMTHKLGGPSVYPPVPKNVLDYNYTRPDYWVPPTGPDRYRRSLYVFRKRSMPDPVLSAFDAPAGDCSVARRVRSNTPLAALTGLNEPVFVEAARALALRVLREGGPDDAARADHAFVLCTSRRPTGAEREEVLNLLQHHRRRLAEGWLSAREVATGDPAGSPALPPNTTPQDAAAWTLVARVLLNLDETVTKN